MVFSVYGRVDMDPKEIKQLIQNGEKIDVEFKESKNALTKDVSATLFITESI